MRKYYKKYFPMDEIIQNNLINKRMKIYLENLKKN
ncbi:Hypothetical protein CCH01_018400 [Clostridium chauvoei JF4335]|nr:Hypothetical protein CCH01_018400 [Clostridium chauvoei JF4335]